MTSNHATPEIPDPQPDGPPPPATASPPTGAPQGASAAPKPRTTRAGVVWAAVVVALLALILLIIFILQNQQPVNVFFLGLAGTVSLGMALFIAAVAGGVLVAAAGAARIIQLRSDARKIRRTQHKSNSA
ncbi:putative integral membrane protein [Arthrobacter sp. GAS37]|uniref:lipopolysaccharide assembly protein LapA domain-containing protein n=1 Tax=Arthrobacter sp. GAS37 TaxID=3156261 RepID=UPI003834AD93